MYADKSAVSSCFVHLVKPGEIVRNFLFDLVYDFISRGVATNFRLGGRILTGGRIKVSRNHLPPNSDFSSDFAHLYFGNVEKSKSFRKYFENFL